MSWGEIIVWALTNAVFTATAIGALGFLSKSLIERWLSRNLEKYKSDLQATNARELERLRADLKLVGFEYEIRFAELHKHRGEVIDELYKRIDRIMQLLQASARRGRFDGERSPEEQRNEAINLVFPLVDYYYQNRLYIDRDLCEQIEGFIRNLYKLSSNIGVASSLVPSRLWLDPHIANMEMEFIDRATKIVTDDLPPIHNLIEKQMRTILGIDGKAN